MAFIFGFIIGVICSVIAMFFIYRNNKKKFQTTIDQVENIVSTCDTSAEIKTKLDAIIATVKK